MKHAVFDDAGCPVAFYDEAIHGGNVSDGGLIPDNAVVITDEDWQELLNNQSCRKWDGEKVVSFERPPEPITSHAIDIERDRRIAAGAVVSIPDYGDVPIQGGGSHDRNMQALGQVALARTGSGDTTTITHFRDAQNVMHELTPPQVMALWMGAVAATEAIYTASWALKDTDVIPEDYADDRYWPE